MKKNIIMYALSDAGLNQKQLNRVAEYISQCDEWTAIDHLKGMIEDPNAYYDVLVREIRNVWHDACYCSQLRRQIKMRRLGWKHLRINKYYGIGGKFESPLAFMRK